MNVTLKDQVAVITGGARGIGEEIALTFAKHGAKVIIADINNENAEKVIKKMQEAGSDNSYIELDVSHIAEIDIKVQEICGKYGRIDIWVNCAGITGDNPIDEITEDEWDTMMDTDLKGVFFCCQAAFKVMKKQRSGKLINISSLAGMRGGRFSGAHYSAAKGGVNILTKCFALSGGDYNIRANAVAPGLIKTKMGEDLGWINQDHEEIPLGRLGSRIDVAKTVLFLASDLSDYITGEIININGGMYMG